MTLTRKRRRYWTCPKCAHRNEHRTSSRKCAGCQENTKPKRRVPRHAETLRDDSYEVYELLSVTIHGGEAGACGCCGRPMPESGHHDREHDHRTGKPRGLACYRCNHLLLRNHTLESLRQCVAYLERVEAHYGGT